MKWVWWQWAPAQTDAWMPAHYVSSVGVTRPGSECGLDLLALLADVGWPDERRPGACGVRAGTRSRGLAALSLPETQSDAHPSNGRAPF